MVRGPQIALWTAGVVVLTLIVNAPLLPILVDWTGLAEVSAVKARIRAKAVRALLRYTKAAIYDLQHDEDEMLRGEPCTCPATAANGPLCAVRLPPLDPLPTRPWLVFFEQNCEIESGIAGVDWKTIRQEVDMSEKLGHLMTGPSGKQPRKAYVRCPSAVHTSDVTQHQRVWTSPAALWSRMQYGLHC